MVEEIVAKISGLVEVVSHVGIDQLTNTAHLLTDQFKAQQSHYACSQDRMFNKIKGSGKKSAI